MSSLDYLSDQMHSATLLRSVLSAVQTNEFSVTGGENATQAAGSGSGNTLPLEPEVQGEKIVSAKVRQEAKDMTFCEIKKQFIQKNSHCV